MDYLNYFKDMFESIADYKNIVLILSLKEKTMIIC